MGSWPADYLRSVEKLNSEPPKTNPSSGREQDLNLWCLDYKSSTQPLGHAASLRPHCLPNLSPCCLPSLWPCCLGNGIFFIVIDNSSQIWSLTFQQEGNWFSQVGKTFLNWTSLQETLSSRCSDQVGKSSSQSLALMKPYLFTNHLNLG